ncbi:MAG: NAD+ synthase [Gemmatimonadetes bacterium]|nr:NAD+ synthase [Gemmatimonadota bacterium]
MTQRFDSRVRPAPGLDPDDDSVLEINVETVRRWLVEFLRQEIAVQRGFSSIVIGLSGGVDSALSAALCAEALEPESVHCFMLPYRSSDPRSLDDAHEVAEALGTPRRVIDIAPAVDGYLEKESGPGAHRTGNVAARVRMAILYDQAAGLGALPVGTSNKSERLLGYFTWHGDDAPAVNPLGDLFKTQVWALGRAMGLPLSVIDKPPTADLIPGQTDENDLGVTYRSADLILFHLLDGRSPAELVDAGFPEGDMRAVTARLDATHWKRRLPTQAMLSQTAIGESYLRPVDY